MSRNKLIVLLFVLVIILAGCTGATPEQTQQVSPPPDMTDAPTPIPATPTPTQTPPPPRVIFYAGEANAPAWGFYVEAALAELANQSGLVLDRRQSLAPADVTGEVHVVVVMAPGDGLSDLVVAAPATQFVAIGISGLQPGTNLTLIGADGERPDLQGFLAGYIAAVATQDWRVGVLAQGDTLPGRAASRGFLAGARYFCGLCNPPFPPFSYPLSGEVPASAAPVDWIAAADVLLSTAIDVRTMYLPSGAGDESLVQHLADKLVNLVGSTQPPVDVRGRWIATVFPDPISALQAVWEGLLGGDAGGSLPMRVSYTDANPDLLTPGRQRLVDLLLEDLNAGFIDTGLDPLTGEVVE